MDEHLRNYIISVLAFYADEETYKSDSSGFQLQYDPNPAPIEKDRGEKARQLMKALS